MEICKQRGCDQQFVLCSLQPFGILLSDYILVPVGVGWLTIHVEDSGTDAALVRLMHAKNCVSLIY